MTVRSVDALTAADLREGQVWFRAVAHPLQQKSFRVIGVHRDHITAEQVDGDEVTDITFGSLFSFWVLQEEAPE